MKLSRYQLLSLEFYLAHKNKPLTMASMFIFNLKLYVWIGISFIAIIVFYYYFVGVEAAIMVGFVLAGVVLRDIGIFRKSVSNWPLLQEIIDWEKAAALKESCEKETPQG